LLLPILVSPIWYEIGGDVSILVDEHDGFSIVVIKNLCAIELPYTD
jgi:hypothetical protein